MSTDIVDTSQRRRIRLKMMAKELGISDRQIRKWLVNGMPHTRLDGVIWCEPDKVHKWLDGFTVKTPVAGVKRSRGMKIVQIGEHKMSWPIEIERTKPIAIGWD